ncbi:dual specificity protein kinase yak1, variant 2 [Basidiobolus ranarum]|uniref:Dual specificity protein kinase yak1, variant 2 n=1 Tax=Basidiobolus ranarum TaxID=34480 RepID=A0ABR2VMB2_9FUNG
MLPYLQENTINKSQDSLLDYSVTNDHLASKIAKATDSSFPPYSSFLDYSQHETHSAVRPHTPVLYASPLNTCSTILVTQTFSTSVEPRIECSRRAYQRDIFDGKSGAFTKFRTNFGVKAIPTNLQPSTSERMSILKSLTRHIAKTYRDCNSKYTYEKTHNPRRVLTKPSQGVKNEGYDNENSDYILYVNDVLGVDSGHQYVVQDILGAGTFGQVAKCVNFKTGEVVGVKVVKNKEAYFNQSVMEVKILEWLNEKYDPDDKHHILRLHGTFIHKHHLCLIFELLSVNLYELIKQNQFRGLSTNLVRVFTNQILDSLCILKEARIIHCDLKPENILLKKLVSSL